MACLNHIQITSGLVVPLRGEKTKAEIPQLGFLSFLVKAILGEGSECGARQQVAVLPSGSLEHVSSSDLSPALGGPATHPLFLGPRSYSFCSGSAPCGLESMSSTPDRRAYTVVLGTCLPSG